MSISPSSLEPTISACVRVVQLPSEIGNVEGGAGYRHRASVESTLAGSPAPGAEPRTSKAPEAEPPLCGR